MPEHRELPLFRWGEELRRTRRARQASRVRVVAAALAAAAATGALATIAWAPRPLLVWNASASSPVGLYSVAGPERLAVGDMAVAWPPEPARALGAERHYLPRGVPLVKRVAAAAGDRVCAVGEAVYVNARLEALRRLSDPAGRPLPWWTGCEDLAAGDLLLLSPDAAGAFDGRYFGITRRGEVIGRARLMWRA